MDAQRPTATAIPAASTTPLPPSTPFPLATPLTSPTPHSPSTPLSPATPLTNSTPRPGSADPHTNQTPTAPSITPALASASPPPRTTTPATSTSNQVPVSAASLLQNQALSTQPPRRKTIRAKLWALKGPLYAVIIVALVDGLALTAPSTTSPLGSISYTTGVLVLSILAMLTGYALSVAAQTAWATVRLRKLSKEQGSGQSLLVFWTLSAETGASCFILWKEFCRLFHRRPISHNRNVSPQTRAGTHTRARGHPKFWSTLRIISWIVMQFPGVIIMTIVNSITSYVPVQWTPVSGGIGIYDPKLAVPDTDPTLIINSALNILQDTRRAVEVDPINSDCIKAGDSCKSFLIPGGLDVVAPWPYQKLKDRSLDVYVTKGGPAYQIDFWSPPDNTTVPEDECSVYAASEDTGLQLCASSYPGGTGQIVAGWTPCTATVLPSGECSQEGSWGAYAFFSTILSISRRTATVYMSRDTGTILAWEDLGKPKLQNITASDFKTAFDIMIIPWSNSSSDIPTTSTTWQLTAQIASSLYINLAAPESSRSLDYLRNLFATPLYVFNPLVLSGAPAITDVQPDLLRENYINGSYAREMIHAVPERWTVLTYVGVSGLLLLIIFLALALGTRYEGPESSLFPFVDSLGLKWIVVDDEEKEVDDMKEVFRAADLGDDDKILEQAGRVRVKLRYNAGVSASGA